jgi:uncharacterized membrane protein YgdD (TMEM256/DUF423 family)
LLARGWWSSPASFTTKTGRHDIAEILLKIAFNKVNQIITKSYLSLLKIGPVLFRGEIHAIKLKGNGIVLQTLVDMFLGYMDLI